jgi:hypothetical protein
LLVSFITQLSPIKRQDVIKNPVGRARMQKYLLISLACSVAASLTLTASYHIPFNIPGLVVYYSIAESYPELQKTGDAVEIQFAWVAIRQPWVWGLLTAHHMVFFAPVSLLIGWSLFRRRHADD